MLPIVDFYTRINLDQREYPRGYSKRWGVFHPTSRNREILENEIDKIKNPIIISYISLLFIYSLGVYIRFPRARKERR